MEEGEVRERGGYQLHSEVRVRPLGELDRGGPGATVAAQYACGTTGWACVYQFTEYPPSSAGERVSRWRGLEILPSEDVDPQWRPLVHPYDELSMNSISAVPCDPAILAILASAAGLSLRMGQINRPSQPPNWDLVMKAAELHDAGLSNSEIGGRLGLTGRQVERLRSGSSSGIRLASHGKFKSDAADRAARPSERRAAELLFSITGDRYNPVGILDDPQVQRLIRMRDDPPGRTEHSGRVERRRLPLTPEPDPAD